MINQRKIRQLIDDAEADYVACWHALCSIKRQSALNPVNKILEFQPNLASRLFKLNIAYREIVQEKKNIVRRKQKIAENWFRRRLKLLAKYQNAIKQIIAVGKSLGDSYAWIFYRQERNCLIEHLKQKEQFHFPPGTGARVPLTK